MNLSPPGDEPYWAFVPASLKLEQPSGPNAATIREHANRAAKPKPLAYANPNSWGYGGGETPWPFDYHRAVIDGRYRAGILNAINSNWTASNWKYVARGQLALVQQDVDAHEAYAVHMQEVQKEIEEQYYFVRSHQKDPYKGF